MESLSQSIGIGRLEQIISCVNVESPNRIVVEGSDEDHRRHRLVWQLPDDIKTIQSRHLHIEKNYVWSRRADRCESRLTVWRFAHAFHVRDFVEQLSKMMTSKALVIDDQYAKIFRAHMESK